ncbi:hypothetical protein JCM14469_00930 [Desulfatiferula olefinivorans]
MNLFPSPKSPPQGGRCPAPVRLTRFYGVLFLITVMIAATGFAENTLFDRLKPRIEIDPGHGGSDAGARGAAGLLEKDLTLGLARALETALQPTYRVGLTRTGDYDLDISVRTESANRSRADLLISLHAGASLVQERRGIIIYYYEQPDKAPGSPTDPAEALWDGGQIRFTPVSQALARMMSDHVGRIPGIAPVRTAGLPAAVLSAAAMPAVIVEAGFITCPTDEKLMADPRMIEHLVQALRAGIDEYFSKYSKGFSKTH